MQIDRNDTAVVFIDPQNEVLSERGAAWAAVGESVKGEQDRREHRADLSSGEPASVRGRYLAPLLLSDGCRLEIQRPPRDIGAREQDVRAPPSIESRRLPRIGSGLARAVQALGW